MCPSCSCQLFGQLPTNKYSWNMATAVVNIWLLCYCVCFNTRKGLQKNIQTWLKVRTKKSVLSPNKEYGGWGIKLIPQFIIRFLSKKLSGKIIQYSKINRSINKNHQKKSYILYRIILVQKDSVSQSWMVGRTVVILPKLPYWKLLDFAIEKFCAYFSLCI